MSSDLIVAIGLVLVIEAILYGAFPGLARRVALEVASAAEGMLRVAGLSAAILGVVLIWFIRG